MHSFVHAQSCCPAPLNQNAHWFSFIIPIIFRKSELLNNIPSAENIHICGSRLNTSSQWRLLTLNRTVSLSLMTLLDLHSSLAEVASNENGDEIRKCIRQNNDSLSFSQMDIFFFLLDIEFFNHRRN